MSRKRLSDILQNAADREVLRRKWVDTKPSDEFGILPEGEYVARILNGECFNSRSNGTPGYKLTFSVIEGEHVGRRFWHEIWLTEAALPMAKRDLGKLGIIEPDQLEQPLREGFVCTVRLVVRRDDGGKEWNCVRSFNLLRIEESRPDPFAPQQGDDTERGAA